MSPRRNRRQGGETPLNRGAAMGGAPARESGPDGDWIVRHVNGTAATKTYRCPGCAQEIPPGAAHLVAWPADGLGGLEDRRHWHVSCWRARDRRRPLGY